MDQETWTQVNSLLSMLRNFDAVQQVHNKFFRCGNVVPSELLAEQIAAVQKLLDKHR